MEIELLHFRFSPYNEKVRWALDLKKLPHNRRSLLPRPHMREIRKLTGQTATPVLRIGDKWIAGSANIISALDELMPEPCLLPADTSQREQVEQIQNKFDTDWGPRIRKVVISALMDNLSDFAEVFVGHKSWFQRLPYRAALPIVKPIIAKGNGITGMESIEDGKTAIEEAMEFLARSNKYLVGNSLTAADLAAASTLASVLDMKGTPMERPIETPPLLRQVNREWGEHAGAKWVERMFEKHRPNGMSSDGDISYQ